MEIIDLEDLLVPETEGFSINIPSVKYNIDKYKILRDCILHDIHKTLGISHKNSLTEQLPNKVDFIASSMSRPRIEKNNKREFTEEMRNYRLSIINGYLMPDTKTRNETHKYIEDNYTNAIINTEELYIRLLGCKILSMFNESPDMPYTSLKYHTILTIALQYNIHFKNYKYEEINLKIIDCSQTFNVFDVIFIDNKSKKYFVLCGNNEYTTAECFTKIGYNFGNVISRLAGDIYVEKSILANLRRIKSWSCGLQYFEDIICDS